MAGQERVEHLRSHDDEPPAAEQPDEQPAQRKPWDMTYRVPRDRRYGRDDDVATDAQRLHDGADHATATASSRPFAERDRSGEAVPRGSR